MMKTVIEQELAKTTFEIDKIKESNVNIKEMTKRISCKDKENVFVSVGLNDIERVKTLTRVGAKNFLIDIANGYIDIKDYILQIKDIDYFNKLMIGNVMTWKGYNNLIHLKILFSNKIAI